MIDVRAIISDIYGYYPTNSYPSYSAPRTCPAVNIPFIFLLYAEASYAREFIGYYSTFASLLPSLRKIMGF